MHLEDIKDINDEIKYNFEEAYEDWGYDTADNLHDFIDTYIDVTFYSADSFIYDEVDWRKYVDVIPELKPYYEKYKDVDDWEIDDHDDIFELRRLISEYTRNYLENEYKSKDALDNIKEAKFKDKVKAIKKSLKKNDKRLSDKTAQKSAEKIAGAMIKNEGWNPDKDLYVKLMKEIQDNLGIDRYEIQKDVDSIKFRYNDNVYFAEPRSTCQVDIFDDNHKQIGWGVVTDKIKQEVFTDYITNQDFIYELVGGEYAGIYTREEAEKLPIKEPELTDDYSKYNSDNPDAIQPRKELQNQFQFNGYLGPMWGGIEDGKAVIRYETQEVYNQLSEAKKLNENNSEEVKNFIKQCEESKKFNDEQIYQIKQGFRGGLSLEQVKLYADIKYDKNQMEEIRLGLIKLSLEQVKLYADPKFKWDQMYEIRKGFEDGLTMEQVKLYADTAYNEDQMDEIRWGFEDGLTLEQVKTYANSKFDKDQMRKIKEQLAKDNGIHITSYNDEDDYQGLTTYIEIIDNGDEVPYLLGYCDEDIDIDIDNRYDLSEDELWATGWTGVVQNLEDAPFNSFDKMSISCFDSEKYEEYDLPSVPANIQKEFVIKINKWVEENLNMLSESNKIEEIALDEEIIERPEDIVEDSEEDKAIHHNEDGTEKTILDYLEERVGQEIEVGRLNTILRSIFGMYQHIFIMPEDLYNMDLDYTQTLTVNLAGEEYDIYYDIVDVDSGIVKIVEVEEI